MPAGLFASQIGGKRPKAYGRAPARQCGNLVAQLTVSPFRTFENLALIRKPISWTTEPSPMVSPLLVVWRFFNTERSVGTPVTPASSAAAWSRLNENSVAKAAGPLAQN